MAKYNYTDAFNSGDPNNMFLTGMMSVPMENMMSNGYHIVPGSDKICARKNYAGVALRYTSKSK